MAQKYTGERNDCVCIIFVQPAIGDLDGSTFTCFQCGMYYRGRYSICEQTRKIFSTNSCFSKHIPRKLSSAGPNRSQSSLLWAVGHCYSLFTAWEHSRQAPCNRVLDSRVKLLKWHQLPMNCVTVKHQQWTE